MEVMIEIRTNNKCKGFVADLEIVEPGKNVRK